METERFEKKQLHNKMDNIIKYLMDIRTPTVRDNYVQNIPQFDFSFINIAVVVLIILLVIDIILRAK